MQQVTGIFTQHIFSKVIYTVLCITTLHKAFCTSYFAHLSFIKDSFMSILPECIYGQCMHDCCLQRSEENSN